LIARIRFQGKQKGELVGVVAELRVPLAVLHGADEQLVNGGYFASVPVPTLWRGVVQTIAGAAVGARGRFRRADRGLRQGLRDPGVGLAALRC
jgi:hypothetical protein